MNLLGDVILPTILLTALIHAAEALEKPGNEGIEASCPSSPPLFIDDAETVEKNHFEVNLSSGFSGNKDVWESEAPLLDANYGLTENIHINAEIPYVFSQDADAAQAGFGRAALALKFRLLHRDDIQIAAHPSFEFPPIPNISLDADGSATLTLPLILDLALGRTGAGMGLEFARTIDLHGRGISWAGMGSKSDT